MSTLTEFVTAEVDRLVKRLELRLVQYRLHLEQLSPVAPDTIAARRDVRETENNLKRLVAWRASVVDGDGLPEDIVAVLKANRVAVPGTDSIQSKMRRKR